MASLTSVTAEAKESTGRPFFESEKFLRYPRRNLDGFCMLVLRLSTVATGAGEGQGSSIAPAGERIRAGRGGGADFWGSGEKDDASSKDRVLETLVRELGTQRGAHIVREAARIGRRSALQTNLRGAGASADRAREDRRRPKGLIEMGAFSWPRFSAGGRDLVPDPKSCRGLSGSDEAWGQSYLSFRSRVRVWVPRLEFNLLCGVIRD